MIDEDDLASLFASMPPDEEQQHPRDELTAAETEAMAADVHRLFPRVDWEALWADESEEEWIVEPILPARRLVAIYSAPKVGKSLLMLEVAVAVAAGRKVLGVTLDRARRVLYVDFENDPKADIRERLQAMGHKPADLDNLVYLSFPSLSYLDGERGSLELLAAVGVYECEVVIIDTVSRAVGGDENENDTWLNFYKHTGIKLKRAGVALIRLDHSGKDETKGQRGGSAKGGDVDAVWRLSTVVADQTYRLDCDMSRMQVYEKTLTIHRETLPHLHHRVDALGRVGAFKAQIDACVALLDSLAVDKELGRDSVRPLLKEAGHKATNAVLAAAIKARRMSGLPVRYDDGQVPPDELSDDTNGQQWTGGSW